MKAIILAAGLGTRLRPMTDLKPKCMVKVAGKPILQHQIDAYLSAGVEQIIVVSGYRGEIVESFCSSYGDQVKIIRNNDYKTTNNMYSLYLALSQLGNEGFILSNGDVVYDPSIVRDVHTTVGSFIVTDKGSYSDESMKIIVKDGIVIDISKKIQPQDAYGNSIDLYRFEKSSAQLFGKVIKGIIEVDQKRNDWTELALQKMLQLNHINMEPFDIRKRSWVEIDNYEDLAIADVKFSSLDMALLELFFIDLDGTLYLGDEIIAGAAEFVKRLQSSGKPFMLLSNNSSKDKPQYVDKLSKYGISVSEESILLSSDGAIAHLKQSGYKSIYVLGTESLRKAVERVNIRTTGEDYEAVLLGYDSELTYEKLKKAALIIQKGYPYIATHADIVCPTKEGPIPDIGSMMALIEKATGKTPSKIFGKPTVGMVEHVIKHLGVNVDKVVFVGDRLYTDMAMARATGAKFILVLSGETKREDVESMTDVPDMIIPSVDHLIRH